MKKINYYLGALALAAMTLASCSSDEPMKGQEPEKVLTDQTQYLAVSICNPISMGRADFEDGSKDESEVKSLVFVFYDHLGNPTATMKTISGSNLKDTDWTNKFNGGNVTRIWTSVIPVELTQGQEVPSYVMCFVNPINTSNLSNMTLKDVEKVKLTRIKNNNGVFTMCNSSYYGDDPISGKTNVRMMATPIKFGLYETEDAANTALTATVGPDDDPKVLDIYVERQAAKIGLTLAADNISTYPVNVMKDDGTSDAKTLTFTPVRWRPNAIDEETFVCKAFATGDNPTTAVMDPTEPASYTDMNNAFANTGMAMLTSGTNPWNDPKNFRCYWACSPAYFANSYPTVSDDITDEGAPTYSLRYFTYNQIINGINGTGVTPADPGIEWKNGFTVNPGNQTTDASGYFYSRETTTAIFNITGEGINHKAVVASAVIVGNYKLTGSTETTPPTFFLYGKANAKDNYYGTEAMVMNAMIDNQTVIFSDINGNNLVENNNDDIFTVDHPSKAVREYGGNVEKVPGRLVTLQLKKVPTPAVYFYDGTGYTAVTDANINHANHLLWKSVTTASKFANGLAFFSIPIRHLGYGLNVTGDPLTDVEDDNTTAGVNEKENANVYNWQNMRRGDFGVVRNHVYTLNVRQIKGLGVGLSSPDQPIVPPMDPDNYYVAARLNILAWRVVPAQGVDL